MSYVAPKTVKLVMLTGAALLAVVPVARWMGRTAAEAQSSRDAAAMQPRNSTWLEGSRSSPASAAVDKPNYVVRTMVSRQSADGITQSDMGPAFLNNLEAWTLERTRVHAQSHWDEAKVPEDKRTISAESTYVIAGPRKLAIVRIRIGQFTPVATIFGVLGSEAIRVMCLINEERDVPVASGACDDKVQEVFGVSVNPLKNSNG